jgi:DegV family protein with EDD domain
MPVQIEGKEYIDDLGVTLKHDDFYAKLRNGIMPTTSQINAYRFEEAFRANLDEGSEVIYVGFSSGLSGTLNSALIARNIILEDTPDAPIYVVDTLSASVGLGAIIVETVKMASNGMDAQQIYNWVQSNHMNAHHWFGVDDLQYLKNGGRINAASAMVGTVLNVKPTLIVDKYGKLKPYGNVRGRKKSMNFLVSKLEEHYHPEMTTTIILGHGNCKDDAETMRKMIQDKYDNVEIIVSELSMTIASHVGPNMLAVAFIGKERE